MQLTNFIVVVIVAFMVLLERNLLGSIQMRTSPIVVGLFGVIQTLVDGVKLVGNGVYKFNLSGVVFVYGALCIVYLDSLISLLIGLIVLGYSFLLGVYSSNNMYSILGGYRAVVVIMAFDIVMIITILLDVSLLSAILFVLLFSSEASRTPVDLVEGESELVSGFNTEYSGVMFVCYFLGEYVVIVVLFCCYFGLAMDVIVIINLAFVIFWRGSYPRMNYNEVVSVFWRSFVLYLMLLVV